MVSDLILSVTRTFTLAKQSMSPFSVSLEPCDFFWPLDYEQIYQVSKHTSGRRPSSGLFHHHDNKRSQVLRWWIQRCKWPPLLSQHMEGNARGSQLHCCLQHTKVMTLICAVCGIGGVSRYISAMNENVPYRHISHLNARVSLYRQHSAVFSNAHDHKCKTPLLCLQK